MAQKDYSPEPWGKASYKTATRAEGPLIVIESGNEEAAYTYNEQNARRIIACINACRGKTTEQLENEAFVRSWI